MTTLHRPSRRGHWALATLGGVIGVLGTVLLTGGVWLAALGGSWYYAPAGAALLIASVLLFRGRNAGAWWFAAVVAASLLWTWWESGSDYWRWVPRLGLIVGLAFVLALLLPKLERPVSRAVSRSVAGVLAAVFVVAFALAFVPFGVTEADGVLAHAAGMAAGLVKRSASASPAVSDGQPANAPADDDWAAYGRSQAGQRYSPLQQINRDNVAQLTRAWVFHTGDLPSKRWGAETTPLKVGDSLYLCTARNQVIALDAASGKERWRYDPKVKDEAIPYTAACRGVSYYQVPAAANDAAAAAAADASALCRTRIIEGTLDGRLIALDARSGKPCTDFGNNGQVAITAGMGQTPPGYVSINSPPAIVRGVVVTGHQVLDGQKRYEPSGVIEGFDAVTGQLRWAWDMTHPDWNGAPPPGQTWTRGTPNMWTTAAADEQLGYVYLPMGNSTADYWSSSRTPQENRYATSLVALDVTTGKPVWNFQTTHIDTWDYDLGSQPSLIDFPRTASTCRRCCCRASRASCTCWIGAPASRWWAWRNVQYRVAAWSRRCVPRRSHFRCTTRCASRV